MSSQDPFRTLIFSPNIDPPTGLNSASVEEVLDQTPNVRIWKLPHFSIAAFTNIGRRDYSQDRILILVNSDNLNANLAVIDGMGGAGDRKISGAIAAEAFAEASKPIWAQNLAVAEAQRIASELVAKRTDPDGGGCFNNVRIGLTEVAGASMIKLSITQAGDCRSVLYAQRSRIFATKDENMGAQLFEAFKDSDPVQAKELREIYKNVVGNAFTGKDPGTTTMYPDQIAPPGSVLVMGSDGFWNHIVDSDRLYFPFIAESFEQDAEQLTELVQLAAQKPGSDNLSFVVVLFH